MIGRWACMKLRDGTNALKAVHVVPLNPDGTVRMPHSLAESCTCSPQILHVPGGVCPVIVHNTEH